MVRHSDGHADFVANVAAAGWWDWEDPLPVVFAGLQQEFPGAFYDVGANTGFYSVLMARLDPDRTVRAFEPLDFIAQSCRVNLELAGVTTAFVEPVALSDHDGPTQIYLPPAEGPLIATKASLDRTFNSEIAGSVTIACERLDTANQRLGAEPIGMVKVDVEGAEHLVLAGAHATVARCRPLLTVELLESARFDAVVEFQDAHDYVSATLQPGLQVQVRQRPSYVADSWNHLLVPAERVDAVVARLSKVRAEFSELRSQLATEHADEFLDDLAAQLPKRVLLTQLAIQRRMLARWELEAKSTRLAAKPDLRESTQVPASRYQRAASKAQAVRSRFRGR
jgi:FkbM family methyltransferase